MKPPRSICSGPILAIVAIVGCAGQPEPAKVPVTTSSEEARRLYVEGRRLHDNVRHAEARERYLAALELDGSFARAHLDLASVAANGKEFFEHLEAAASLAGQVSRGEREMILAYHAGMNGRPSEQFEHISKLVELHPGDERARTALGHWYFWRHEWSAAIEQYRRATELAPDDPSPYNQLGYAYRHLERWRDAEHALEKYIELLPNEPNPHDSYAEMLMKQGRFVESIASYEKALEIDASFAPSFRGIGTNYVFLGQFEKARETYSRLFDIARIESQKRDALYWTATSYVHEGRTDEALSALRRRHEIAERSSDASHMADDLRSIGFVLLEASRTAEARDAFEASLALIENAGVPESIRESVRRNHRYHLARVQLAEGDVEGATANLEAYRSDVEANRIHFETQNVRYLEALVASSAGDHEKALAALKRAKRDDPRVLFLEAEVLREKGETAAATAAFEKVASYNAFGLDYAFVRSAARELVAEVLPN